MDVSPKSFDFFPTFGLANKKKVFDAARFLGIDNLTSTKAHNVSCEAVLIFLWVALIRFNPVGREDERNFLDT